MNLREHLGSLPNELAVALEQQYRNLMEHFLLQEWDDAQVDAGKFAEAVLRVLQWHSKGRFTPLDGKSKPNRKAVTQGAQQDTSLPPSLRQQVPQATELIMDFRNNRSAAHLGTLNPNKLDAMCVVQLATWVMGELVRLETSQDASYVQVVLDQLAERQIPVIEVVGQKPVVLDTSLSTSEQALVLLYHDGNPVDSGTLRGWVEYGHSTRWKERVLRKLQAERKIFVDEDDQVHLLMPGRIQAEKLLISAGAL